MQAFSAHIIAFSLIEKTAKHDTKNVRFWFKKTTIFQLLTILLLALLTAGPVSAQLDPSQAAIAVDGLAECAAIYMISTDHTRDDTSKTALLTRAKQFLDAAFVVTAKGELPETGYRDRFDSYVEKYRPQWPLSILQAYKFKEYDLQVDDFIKKFVIEKCNTYDELVNLVAKSAQ